MIWDSPLYAVNMLYCHWLIKKLLLANGLTEYSQARKDLYRENRRSQGDIMQLPKEKDTHGSSLEPFL